MTQKPFKKFLLLIAGWLALTAGLIGIVLPLLPTTPFLLLAAFCFARSSPRLHAWLLTHRWFGPPIHQWLETRTVSRKSKTKALSLLVVTFSLTLILTPLPTAAQAALLILAILLMLMVARLPEQPKTDSEINLTTNLDIED